MQFANIECHFIDFEYSLTEVPLIRTKRTLIQKFTITPYPDLSTYMIKIKRFSTCFPTVFLKFSKKTYQASKSK